MINQIQQKQESKAARHSARPLQNANWNANNKYPFKLELGNKTLLLP